MITHFAADISFDASNSAEGILNIFYYLPKIQENVAPRILKERLAHIKKLPGNQNPV